MNMKIIISESVIQENIKIENLHIDFRHGEHIYNLVAKINNKVIGKLNYGVYDEEPNVKMIEVDGGWLRMGVATTLLKKLQSLYPEQEIDLGSSTEEGGKFLKSIKRVFIPNKKYEKLNNRLIKIKSEKNRILSAVQSNDNSEIHKLNDLSDEIYELESELQDLKNGKWLIQ